MIPILCHLHRSTMELFRERLEIVVGFAALIIVAGVLLFAVCPQYGLCFTCLIEWAKMPGYRPL